MPIAPPKALLEPLEPSSVRMTMPSACFEKATDAEREPVAVLAATGVENATVNAAATNDLAMSLDITKNFKFFLYIVFCLMLNKFTVRRKNTSNSITSNPILSSIHFTLFPRVFAIRYFVFYLIICENSI